MNLPYIRSYIFGLYMRTNVVSFLARLLRSLLIFMFFLVGRLGFVVLILGGGGGRLSAY